MQKDEALDRLAELGNVAQFVAYRPDGRREPRQTFSRIRGHAPNARFESVREAAAALLAVSPEKAVNLRSYEPGSPRSREFIYGVATAEEAAAAAHRLADNGLSVIVNETVDIRDGGVSGVVQGSFMEFAPDDTPRCVEKPGVAALPAGMGSALLRKVYGAAPDVELARTGRLEFSVHPRARGYRAGHVLTWELEETPPPAYAPRLTWPNRFSRLLGDKAFGLLVANEVGLPVPRTTVIGRRVAPFTFGSPTGSIEVWTRTCPVEPQPGLFTTVKGWTDPFALLAREDGEGAAIASVVRQDAVVARFAGAAIVAADGELVIEGKEGEGDAFMLGLAEPEPLPAGVLANVRALYEAARAALGPVRFEWVHDGMRAWVVQLHLGATGTTADVVVAGEPESWVELDAADGLPALRQALSGMSPGAGIRLLGAVGSASHFADLLRKAGRPARIVKPAAEKLSSGRP